MTVNLEKKDSVLTVKVTDRLDTTTAPDLEREVLGNLDGVEELILDFSELVYISSAGLRVLLIFMKRMNEQGSMKVIGVNDEVNQVFQITGFDGILTIE